MKKILFSTLFTTVSMFAIGQNLITVGILPDLDTDFSSIQAAIDAATSGDIIQITPGVYSETGITIDKPVYIQGAGYLVEANYNTLGIISGSTHLTSTISIDANGSNSIIEGLDINTLNITDAVDVIIQRTRIRRAIFTNLSAEFQGCYLGGSNYGTPHDAQFLLSDSNHLSFVNCLFAESNNNVNGIASDERHEIFRSLSSGVVTVGQISFDRCIFRNYIAQGLTGVVVIVSNSIFLTNQGRMSTSTNSNASGSVIVNSLFEVTSSEDALSSNNIFGISGAAEFNGYPSGTPSFDAQYMLSDTSQAMGYANDGGDCGIFGGVNPYVLSGIPSIPFIYNFDANQQGSTGGGLDVNIRVRSQN